MKLTQQLVELLKLLKPEGKDANLTIEAKVFRADTGECEDLGVISKGRFDIKTKVE